jgi:WD40 repeat protein
MKKAIVFFGCILHLFLYPSAHEDQKIEIIEQKGAYPITYQNPDEELGLPGYKGHFRLENGKLYTGFTKGMHIYDNDHRKDTRINFAIHKEANASFIDDEGKLWVGYTDGTVVLYSHDSAQKPSLELDFAEHGPVSFLRKNGDEVFSCHEDGTIILLTKGQKKIDVFKSSTEHNAIWVFMINKKGKFYLCHDNFEYGEPDASHKTIFRWDDDKKIKQRFDGHNDIVTCLDFDFQGRMFSGSQDKTVRVWDTKTTACLKLLKPKVDLIYGIKILQNGNLCFGDRYSKIGIWDTKTWKPLICLNYGDDAPAHLFLQDDNGNLYVASRTLCVWNHDKLTLTDEIKK